MGFLGRLLGADHAAEFGQFVRALEQAHRHTNKFRTVVHGVHTVVRYFPMVKALSDQHKKDPGRRDSSVRLGRLLELKRRALEADVSSVYGLMLPSPVFGILAQHADRITPKLIEQINQNTVRIRVGHSDLAVAAWERSSPNDLVSRMADQAAARYALERLVPVRDLAVEIHKGL